MFRSRTLPVVVLAFAGLVAPARPASAQYFAADGFYRYDRLDRGSLVYTPHRLPYFFGDFGYTGSIAPGALFYAPGYGYNWPDVSYYPYSYYAAGFYYYAPGLGYYWGSRFAPPGILLSTSPPRSDLFVAAYQPARSVLQTGQLKINVPDANAKVWVNGREVTGATKSYESPLLENGQSETVTVKAVWSKDGRSMIEVRKAEVTAGAQVAVDFAVPARTKSATP